MAIDYDQAIAAVEVFALEEVRNAPSLGSSEGEILFKRLMLDAVTLIVEEHLANSVRLGGRHIDGDDDEDGDGPRLHAWLEKRGVTYKLVILRFDRITRTPPVVTDTMAIVHGERALIGRFVVYGEANRGRLTIEHIPGDRLSDERPMPDRRRRPALSAKPVVHRIGVAFGWFWRRATSAGLALIHWLRCRAEATRRGIQRRIALSGRLFMPLELGRSEGRDHLRRGPPVWVPLRLIHGRSGSGPELTGMHLAYLHGVVRARRTPEQIGPSQIENGFIEMVAAEAVADGLPADPAGSPGTVRNESDLKLTHRNEPDPARRAANHPFR